MIRLPQWHFVEDENHQWRWIYTTGDVRAVSAAAFSSQADCVLDAVRTVVQARRRSDDLQAPTVPHKLHRKLSLRGQRKRAKRAR
jgi:hypothetical protein